MAVAIDAIGLKWLAPIIKIGAILGLSSVILVSLLGQARILYSMAKDKLLPGSFADVHSRFNTPHVATAITGTIVTVLAGLLPIELIGELVSIGTLLAFAIVCIAVLALRITRPALARPFRTPAVWLVAPAGVVSSVVLMFSLPGDTWIRLAVWLVVGLLIYVSYGMRSGSGWSRIVELAGGIMVDARPRQAQRLVKVACQVPPISPCRDPAISVRDF